MRKDYLYNRSELRFGMDKKLIKIVKNLFSSCKYKIIV